MSPKRLLACLVLCLAAAALAACSKPAEEAPAPLGAYSELPLFAAGDEAGAPRLREGLWLQTTDQQSCPVDTDRPVGEWPDCANWRVVFRSRDLTLELRDEDGQPRSWDLSGRGFLLTAEDPRIFQYQATDRFTYLAMFNPVSDDGATITQYRTTWIACSGVASAPEPETEADKSAAATQLEPVEDDCRFDDQEKLRLRARTTIADIVSGEGALEYRWIRSFAPGDLESVRRKPLPAPPDPQPEPAPDPTPASKPAA